MDIIYCPSCGEPNPTQYQTCQKCKQDLTLLRAVISTANKHYNQALELARAGKYDEAVVEIQSAIGLNAHHPKYYNLLGSIYANKGLYSMATREWEKTILLDDESNTAYQNIERVRKFETLSQKSIEERPTKWSYYIISVLCIILFGWSMKLLDTSQDRSKEIDILNRNAIKISKELNDTRKQLASSNMGVSDAVVEQLKQKIQKSGEEITTLNSYNLELKKIATQQKDKISVLEEQLLLKDKEISDASGTIKELTDKLASRTLTGTDIQSELQKLEQEKKDLEKQFEDKLKSIEKNVTNLQKSADEFKNQNNDLKTSLAGLKKDNENLNKQISTVQAVIDEKDKQITYLSKGFMGIIDESYDDAVNNFENYLTIEPDDVIAKNAILYARSLQQESEDPILQIYNSEIESERNGKLEEIRSRESAQYLSQGRQKLKDKLYTQAIEDFEKALQISPDDSDIAETIQNTKDLYAIQKTEAYKLLESGNGYMEAGNWDDAVKTLTKASETLPEDTAISQRLGIAIRERDAAKSADEQKQAEIKNLYDQGVEAYKNEDYKTSIEILTRLLELDPEHRGGRRYLERASAKIESVSP